MSVSRGDVEEEERALEEVFDIGYEVQCPGLQGRIGG